LCKAPSYNSIDELMNDMISSTKATVSNQINYAKAQTSSRRVEIWMSRTGDDIYVRFLGKKKQWLGWFKNDMQFMGEFNLSCSANNPFEFYETPYFGYPYQSYRNEEGKTFRIITKVYKDITVNFGRVNYRYYPELGILRGRMEIWSSELSYNDRGIGNVELARYYY